MSCGKYIFIEYVTEHGGWLRGSDRSRVTHVATRACYRAKWHVRRGRVTAGCSLDAGRQQESTKTLVDVTWIKDRAHISRTTFLDAPILTVVLIFASRYRSSNCRVVINSLSAFSIVFRSSLRWLHKRNICSFFRLLDYLIFGTE